MLEVKAKMGLFFSTLFEQLFGGKVREFQLDPTSSGANRTDRLEDLAEGRFG